MADLARGLAARGHEIYAAVAPGSPLEGELRALKLKATLTLPLRNALDLWSAWRLGAYARAHAVEVVHAHVARDYTLAAFAAGVSGARLIGKSTCRVMQRRAPARRAARAASV